MASKVLVKLPTMPFPQGKKTPDIVTSTERAEGLNQTTRHRGKNVDRVAQLEQNMKFLQEQHRATLIAFHKEVESLRQRNRDLQFQLVFSKGSARVPSTPSSPEDNGSGFAKSKGSPVCVNVMPLWVELLEKDLQDTKTALLETRTQNQYMSEIIERQKKKLDLLDEERHKPSTTDVGIQAKGRSAPTPAELTARWNNATAMRGQYRKRQEDQRKEIETVMGRFVPNMGPIKDGRSCECFNSYDSRRSRTSAIHETTSDRFPPLHSRSYRYRKMLRDETSRHDERDD